MHYQEDSHPGSRTTTLDNFILIRSYHFKYCYKWRAIGCIKHILQWPRTPAELSAETGAATLVLAETDAVALVLAEAVAMGV